MDCCFFFTTKITATTTTTSSTTPTAIVIALDGSFIKQSLPITVSKALGIDHLSCFLCNSDSLLFDTCIPQLNYNDYLQKDQIYFVLPKSKLGQPLTGTDMAALAVKASSALVMASERIVTERRKITGSVPVQVGSEKAKSKKVGDGWAEKLRRSLKRTLSSIDEVDDE